MQTVPPAPLTFVIEKVNPTPAMTFCVVVWFCFSCLSHSMGKKTPLLVQISRAGAAAAASRPTNQQQAGLSTLKGLQQREDQTPRAWLRASKTQTTPISRVPRALLLTTPQSICPLPGKREHKPLLHQRRRIRNTFWPVQADQGRPHAL